jgi:hypothetical protein
MLVFIKVSENCKLPDELKDYILTFGDNKNIWMPNIGVKMLLVECRIKGLNLQEYRYILQNIKTKRTMFLSINSIFVSDKNMHTDFASCSMNPTISMIPEWIVPNSNDNHEPVSTGLANVRKFEITNNITDTQKNISVENIFRDIKISNNYYEQEKCGDERETKEKQINDQKDFLIINSKRNLIDELDKILKEFTEECTKKEIMMKEINTILKKFISKEL